MIKKISCGLLCEVVVVSKGEAVLVAGELTAPGITCAAVCVSVSAGWLRKALSRVWL